LLGVVVLSIPASLLVPSEPEPVDVLPPTLVLGEVLVEDPVVAELSVGVPVVAELSVDVPVFALPLTPVFGAVVVPVPVVVDPLVPVVDPLTPV
jgi:hypothetical protein